MNVLIIGSGGRESAFGWKISQSKLLSQLFIAPGNPGTKAYGTNVPISITDFEALGKFCIQNFIEIVVVGPELPLVEGIYDYFENNSSLRQISVIGPSKLGAQLEGSKDFSKAFMIKYGIPTASYETFTEDNLKEGIEYLTKLKPPYVLKADGLAAGKGVIITEKLEEAQSVLNQMIVNKSFGEASAKVVIEEYLNGIEVSVFVLTDGKNYLILPEAKDYKRIGEGDTGPNTGGMGAVSPVYFADEKFMQKVENEIIKPTIEGLKKENINYKGFIFIGLMNVKGNPKVIEYNCRMGDPETEVVLPRIKSDLLEILSKVKNQLLNNCRLEVEKHVATTVMCVAGGYPDEYKKGDVISGIDKVKDAILFHAGTSENAENKVVTNGGRVMALTGIGSTIEEALKKSIAAANTIQWRDKYFRKDIGKDLMS
ncbi:MAG: phosphoribosylamine--glycine ligase [Bacteroidota bacterium]|nr:phosphoribosylamine--glycine ligase [Bacteroidota bacterium]